MNNGQLVKILRSTYLVDAIGFSKVQGKPFKISEVANKIRETVGRKAKLDTDTDTGAAGAREVGGG